MRGETEECNESMKSRSLKERGDMQTRAQPPPPRAPLASGRRWLWPRIRGVAAAPSPAARLGLARVCFLRKDGGPQTVAGARRPGALVGRDPAWSAVRPSARASRDWSPRTPDPPRHARGAASAATTSLAHNLGKRGLDQWLSPVFKATNHPRAERSPRRSQYLAEWGLAVFKS